MREHFCLRMLLVMDYTSCNSEVLEVGIKSEISRHSLVSLKGCTKFAAAVKVYVVCNFTETSKTIVDYLYCEILAILYFIF